MNPEAAEALDGRPRRGRGSTVGLIASTLLVPALQLLSGPLIARALGPRRRGQYALLTVWNEVGTNLFRMGMPEAVAYFDQRGEDRPTLWSSARRIALRVTPVAICCGVLISYLLIREEAPRGLAVLIGVTVAWSPLVDTLALVRLRLLVSSRDLGSISRFNMIQPVFLAGVTSMLFACRVLTLATVSATFIVGQMIGYLYLYHQTRIKAKSHPERQMSARLVSYGIRVAPGSLGEIINSRLDQLLMPAVLGTSELGIYAVAVGVAGLASRVGFSLSQSEFAKVGRAGAGMQEAAALSIRRSTTACLGAGLMLAAGCPVVIPVLFGAQYARAVAPCLILLLGTSFSGANLVASNLANLLGRPGIGSWSQIVGLGVTVMS